MRRVVVNSTPIISLSIINKLDLLKALYGEVYIPYGVFEEVSLEGKSKVGNDVIEKSDFIIIEKIINESAKRLFQTSLHKGEVEVMILADEIKADLCIIDDLLARKYAKYLGLKITGTLGVLIKAKEKEIIKEVKPLIDDLIRKGIYIDDKIYRKVLELTGEYK